jgi:hypothetical protein
MRVAVQLRSRFVEYQLAAGQRFWGSFYPAVFDLIPLLFERGNKSNAASDADHSRGFSALHLSKSAR